MNAASPSSETPLLVALLLGLVVAAAFTGFASLRLEGQGPHYDEVNKAIPAFAWVGRPSTSFSLLRVKGIPMMSGSFRGVVRGHIYGIWMRTTERPFGIASWRLSGILLVTAALLAFSLLARRVLSPLGLATFLVLVAISPAVIISTRCDWGPTAVALALRVLLLAFFVRAARPPVSSWNSFFMGALVGFACFEKLSSVVLLGVLAAAWMVARARWNRRHLIAVGAGLLVGGLPLLIANVYWLYHHGTLLSLRDIGTLRSVPADHGSDLLQGLFTLNAGSGFRSFVLGTATPPILSIIEAAGIGLALLLALLPGRSVDGPHRSIARGLVLAFALVGAGLFLLPEGTWWHHWILAFPLPEAALAVALSGVPAWPARSTRRILMATTLVALLGGRTVSTGLTVSDFLQERAARNWTPSLQVLGSHLAQSPPGERLVALDWGIAVPVFCLTQGARDEVCEAFWANRGQERLETALGDPTCQRVHLVAFDPPTDVAPDTARRLLEELPHRAGWQRVPTPGPLASLPEFTIITLERN